MTTHLQREIDKLKKKILYMGAEAEEILRIAVESLVSRNVKLAQEAIESDERLDHLEVEIEEDCLKILALHQPVATDLRYVIAVLKINNDLERIGDLAVNIAERVIYLADRPSFHMPLDLKGMARLTQLMVKRSLDAIVNTDSKLARDVRASDDEIDDINRDMYDVITEYITKNPDQVEPALHVLSATRHLERIADQATNIAEDVIYLVEGDIVRHQPEAYSPGNTENSK